jgi:hypothetical protein
MKKILPILFALIIILSFTSEVNAQGIRKQYEDREVYQPELKPNYNEELKQFHYEEVVSLGLLDVNKDELYDKLYRWVAINFNSANHVIQLSDKTNNNIVVKGRLEASWSSKRSDYLYYIPFTLDLKMKDGRYKYDLTISSYTRNVTSSDIYDSERLIDNRLFNKYQNTHKYGDGDVYSKIDNTVKSFLANMQLFVLKEEMEEEEDW